MNRASWIQNPEDGHAWVGSYGIKRIEGLIIDLVPGGSGGAVYDVTLYFAEPEDASGGIVFLMSPREEGMPAVISGVEVRKK